MSIFDKISFGRGKKSAKESAGTKQPAAKKISRKARKETLAGVISPTPWASALSVLKTEPKLKAVDQNGRTCYLTFLLNADDPCIGGINRKRKKNEEIGSIISVIQNDRMQIYANDDLLKADEMIILPTKKTIRTMGEFRDLRDANLNYQMALAYQDDKENIDVYDATMDYDEINRYLNDDTTDADDLLVDKRVIKSKPKQMQAKEDKSSVMSGIAASTSDIDPNEVTMTDESPEEEEKADERQLLKDRPDNNKQPADQGTGAADSSVGDMKAQNGASSAVGANAGNASAASAAAGSNANNSTASANSASVNSSQAGTTIPGQAVTPNASADQGAPQAGNNDTQNLGSLGALDQAASNGTAANNTNTTPLPAAGNAPTGGDNSSAKSANNSDTTAQGTTSKQYLEQGTVAPGDDIADDDSNNMDLSSKSNDANDYSNQSNLEGNPAIVSQGDNNQGLNNNPAIVSPEDINNYGNDENSASQPDITDDQVNQELHRTLYDNPWQLDISTADLDSILAADNSLIPFDENRKGWLGTYVNQIAKQANQQLASVHEAHIREVKQYYLDRLTKLAEDTKNRFDDQNKNSEYFTNRQNLDNQYMDQKDNLDDRVSKQQDKLKDDFDKRAQQAADTGAQQARANYVERHQGELRDRQDSVRQRLEAEIEQRHEDGLSDLSAREKKSAMNYFDLGATKALQQTLKQYKDKLKNESKLEESYRKRIVHYVNNHRKEDVQRSQALADEVKQQNKSKKLQQSYEKRINEMIKDSDNRRKTYEKQLAQSEKDNKAALAEQKRNYEAQISQMSNQQDALKSQISALKSAREAAVQAVKKQAQSDASDKMAALKAQYDNERDSLNMQLKEAKSDLAKANSNAGSQADSIARSANAKIQVLQNKVNDLQAKLDKRKNGYQKDIDELKDEVKQQYELKLENARMKNENFREQVNTLQETVNNLRTMQRQQQLNQQFAGQMPQSQNGMAPAQHLGQTTSPQVQQASVSAPQNSARKSNSIGSHIWGIVAVAAVVLFGGFTLYNNQQEAQRNQELQQQLQERTMAQQRESKASKNKAINEAVKRAVAKQEAKDKKKTDTQHQEEQASSSQWNGSNY